MGFFDKKEEETQLIKLYNQIKKDQSINEENKNYLLQLVDRVNASASANPFATEEELIQFIKVVLSNNNLDNRHYNIVFNDALSLYANLRMGGFDFYGSFLRIFGTDGLYDNNLFSLELLSIFEFSENYFSIMNVIMSDELYRNNFNLLKKLLFELAIYTPNDIELRTMFLHFLEKCSFNGNLEDAIDTYVSFAQKRAGIYVDLDDTYLKKLESLVAKSQQVFDVAKKETEKLESIRREISVERTNVEGLITTFDETLARTDETMGDISRKYLSALDQKYLEVQATLRNDVLDLKRQLLNIAEKEGKEQATKAIAELDSRVEEILGRKHDFELNRDNELEELNRAREEARSEVAKALKDIKAAIQDSGLDSIPDLAILNDLVNKNGGNSSIISPQAAVIETTNVINSSSIATTDGLVIPEILRCFDDTIDIKKRYYEIMERKKRKEDSGVVYHEIADDVIYAMLKNYNPYLFGPSGSGKTYFVKQIAELMGLPLVDIGYITEEYELIGSKDAHGNYSKTPFFDCYFYGYLAHLDELDNGVPAATIKLHNFLDKEANESYFFPVIGFTKRHPNMRIISSGNTNGMGATRAYNVRTKLDEATQNRIMPFDFGYCDTVEKSILSGYDDLAAFIKLYREAVNNFWREQNNEVMGQITTRNIAAIVSDFKDGIWDEEKIIRYQFIRNKDEDFLASVSKYLQNHEMEARGGRKLVKTFVNLCEQNNGKIRY